MKIYYEVRPEFEARQFVVGNEVEIAEWMRDRHDIKCRIAFDPLVQRVWEPGDPVRAWLEISGAQPGSDNTIQLPSGMWIVYEVQKQRWLFLSDEEFQQNFEEKLDVDVTLSKFTVPKVD